MNFSYRNDCFQCGVPKSGELVLPEPQTSQRAGDWICNNCGSNNFSRRTFCFKCRRGKEDNRPNTGGNQRQPFGQDQPQASDVNNEPQSRWNRPTPSTQQPQVRFLEYRTRSILITEH